MKKIIIIQMVAAILPSIAFAQLKVNSSGNVKIGTGSDTYVPLTIYGNTTSSYTTFLSGYRSVLRIDNVYDQSTPSSSPSYSIKIDNSYVTSGASYGVCAITENSSINTSSLAIGLYGNGKQTGGGFSIGVAGSCRQTGYGASIYGAGSGSYSAIDGHYAGFFSGNVKVTGTIDGTLVNSSDARLKENVQPLSENAANRGAGVLNVLESLTPVSFKYKKMEEEKKETLDTDDEEATEEEELPNPVMEKEHFGLIAQELQEVYPNLVYEKDNGYLAVNYVELVPVLMQAIKELNAKVESLEADRANRSPLLREGGVRGGSDETASIGDDSLPFREGLGVGSSMDQNVPNPFSEKTDIAIFLPESVQTATLYIYDLSGKQIEQHPVDGRGNTVMTIHAERMDAGMYVYSLIADKKVVTTRKMIVVK